MKRFTAMLLVVSLLCTLMAGCSGKENPGETTAPENEVTETTVPVTTEQEVSETTVPATTEQEIPETTVPATTAPEEVPETTAPKNNSSGKKPGKTDPPATNPPATNPPPTNPPPTNPPATEPPATNPPATNPPENTEPMVYTSFYTFYDYANVMRVSSEIATFQAVTGGACISSSVDFGFLEDEDYEGKCEGYNEMYSVYIYKYNQSKLDAYIRYLESQGFTLVGSETFKNGISCYYENAETGYKFDIFIGLSETGIFEYLAIEPYLNASVQ